MRKKARKIPESRKRKHCRKGKPGNRNEHVLSYCAPTTAPGPQTRASPPRHPRVWLARPPWLYCLRGQKVPVDTAAFSDTEHRETKLQHQVEGERGGGRKEKNKKKESQSKRPNEHFCSKLRV